MLTMQDIMRMHARMFARTAGALAVAAFAASAAVVSPAIAQEDGAGMSASAQAQQVFAAGKKAYSVGKFDEAMRAFEAAIRGGLPTADMPSLLYYRGLTFRKQGKPGFAISDLTSALWMKNGLSDAERADAIKIRALAYNEAGVSSVPPVPQSPHAAPPSLGTSPATQVASAVTGAASAAGAVSAAPAAPTPQSSSGSGGGITGFFSNLFGGGSSSNSAPEPAPAAAPAASGWSTGTEVVAQQGTRPAEVATPFVTQVAAVGQASGATAVGQSSARGSEKYRLQVASVRTRSEAESLAGLLTGRHGSSLGGRKPIVDEAVIGSMGTFYRVQVGPYADTGEPERLCSALQADGFDCMLMIQ